MFGIVVDKTKHFERQWVVFSTFQLIEGLRKAYDGVIISSQEEYEAVKDKLTACYCTFPGWSSPRIEHDTSLNYTKGMIISDVHHKDAQEWVPAYLHDNDFDYLLAYYYHPTLYHYPHLREKTVHTTWCIPDEYLGDDVRFHGDEKIQIFGAINHEAYTTRRWCHQFPFVEVDSNSGVESPSKSEADYYRWLGDYDAIIAAGSLANAHQLLTPKHYEILNSGALLFAQFTRDLELNGLNESNCVIFDESNFEQKAKDYLANPESYLERRKNGQKLIRERHTVSKRVKEIGNILGAKRKETRINTFAGLPNTSATFFLDDHVARDQELQEKGVLRPELTEFLRHHIKPGMSCVDVGANTGYSTVLFGLLGAHVIAFEPVHLYRAVLRRNLAANQLPHTCLFPYGLSSRSECPFMRISESSASLKGEVPNPQVPAQQVDLFPLDEVFDGRVDVLHIDVDGFEKEVLLGARNTLGKQNPLLLCELKREHYTSNKEALADMYTLLSDCRYQISFAHAPRHSLTSRDEFIEEVVEKKELCHLVAQQA